MKKIFLLSLPLLMLLPMFCIGQSIAPTVEWDFQSPSIVPGFENDDNWAYTPMQASDGSIVAVGFSDKYNGGTTGIRHPSILKYVPGPIRKIQWESIPTYQNPGLGITLADAGRGGFLDVFESNESGTKYLYACGTIVKSGSGELTPVVAKFLLSTGALVYFTQVTSFVSARFTRMSPIVSGGVLTSIYVAGESSVAGGTTKATIFKVKPSDGTLDTGFDGDGWRQYSAPAPNAAKPTFFKDLAFAPNVSGLGDGFIAVGSVLKSGGSDPWVQPDRDVFMVRLRADNGNIATGWPVVFTESSLGGLYTDLNSPEPVICAGTNQETTLNEEGFSIKRMPDNNFAVLCRFDFIELKAGQISCVPFNTEQYYDNDLALVKINQTTGATLYALDAGRSVALDGWNVMATTPGCNEIYISANAFNAAGPPPNGEVLGSVLRVDDLGSSFAYRWRKDALGKHWEICTFGICLTADQGIVICGNNGIEGDNYEFIKFSNDRQVNTTFTQPSTNIMGAVTWNTPRTVKGVITVKSGGTLTIDNTTIQFANTYTTNDWRTLAQGSGAPTKIVVEPNGKLILTNNCVLKGMGTSSCPSGTQEWMWEGIVLLGQPAASQVNTSQGYVEMSLNAQIKNAYGGIHVGSTTYNSDGVSTSTGNEGGGIIKCQNPSGSTTAHFLNCRRSIWYAPVTNAAAPPWTFMHTNFLCDQPMVDVNYVDTEGGGRIGISFFVGSWNRDNLYFQTCTFKSTGTYPEKNRGHGVENFDAKMAFDACTFQQLYKGIYAQYGVGVTDPTTINGCTFTQVRQGGHIVGGAWHTSTGSLFQQIPANLPSDVSYGLRFEGSTNLTVSENNTFSSTSSGTYGVIIKDCAANASEFARNTFTNVDFGVQTEQNNAGLQIRCNGYTGNDRAWSINPASPPNTSGLFPNQGICGGSLLQAGNLFNDPDCPSPGIAESHIKSKLNFAYRARSGSGYNANEIPTCMSNGPTGTNGIVSVDLCGLNSNVNACAPPCTNCFAAQSMMSAADNESDTWNQQNMYNQAVNLYLKEGNAQAALDVIKNHFPSDPNLALGLLVNSGNYEAAQAKVATLGLDESSKDLVALYQVAIDLGKGGKSIIQMDFSQESKLLQVAQGNSPAKYAAQNILTFAKGYVFDRPVEVWKEEGLQGESSDRSTEKVLLSTSTSNWLGLSPNPTTGMVDVQWNLREGQGTLEVFNLSGKLILQEKVVLSNGVQVITLTKNPPGIYLVRLRSAAGSVTSKLIIE